MYFDLEKARRNKEVDTANIKRKAKLDEIDKIKKQKLNVENTISELQDEIENETLAAEKKTRFSNNHESCIFF